VRPCRIQTGALRHAEGSCQIELGDTKVLCAATVEDRVPPWLYGSDSGWVTAEYAMLPRAGKERTPRERVRPAGRSMEIQRLIGRCLRAVVDLRAIGERTITVDCDVLQADGGTRTAAVTGAFAALAEAIAALREERVVRQDPIRDVVAAVSTGIVGGEMLLDLCYEEDRRASVDMNLAMCGRGAVVEIQATAEGAPFTRQQMDELISLGQQGIQQLVAYQREVLGDKLKA
jgi:ribonuclease PH